MKTYQNMIAHIHNTLSATMMDWGQTDIVSHYQDSSIEKAAISHLALCDCSALMRCGFKGTDTPVWLQQQDIAYTDKPNRAQRLKEGGLIARLSDNEFLLLGDIQQPVAGDIQKLATQWQLKPGHLNYLLERFHSHAYFMLTGVYAEQVMSKLCGIDLRDGHFKDLQVAQTSVARLSTIVIKDKHQKQPCFHLLFDSASAEYMWNCFIDAIAEYEGLPVGISILQI